MKRIIILGFILSLLFSCTKKAVKIPIVALDGPIEISNNSQIWMFYNENAKKSKLKLNEKNRISTTNWLFNIDKRLRLKEVFPEAKRLLFKHKKKSPHSDGTMKNYFSYVNSLNKKWTFYQFDSVDYQFTQLEQIKSYISNKDTVLVHLSKESLKNIKPIEITQQVVQLAFEGDLTFQNYLELKAGMLTKNKTNKISTKEYIIVK